MGCDWNICLNLNVWDVFWMNQVQMRQCRRKVGEGLQVLLDLWLILGV